MNMDSPHGAKRKEEPLEIDLSPTPIKEGPGKRENEGHVTINLPKTSTDATNKAEDKSMPNGAYYGFYVAVMYGIISISITFFNKAVFSVYDFHYPNTLTLGQMIFAVLALVIGKGSGYISYPDFELSTAKKLLPLGASFFLMVLTGLAAMMYMSVPMYSAVRRITTLIVMIGEYLILGKSTPTDESASVYGMVLGAVVAAAGDLSFNPIGYVLCFFNCIITAVYLIYITKKKTETGLNTFGLMFYNNLFSIPVVAVIVLATEWDMIYSNMWMDYGFLVCFATSSVQAFLLNYYIFLCSIVNSPLTTSVTGQIKNIVTTGVGLFIFGDVLFSTLLFAGLIIATLASVWYTQIKYAQSVAREREKKEGLKV